jgi:CBS domain-containing protein
LTSSGGANVVLLHDNPESRVAIGTYDYDDLNAYLLLVIGLANPPQDVAGSFNELTKKGQEGKPIPLKDVKNLGKKEPLVTLPKTAKIPQAMEVFGGGVHRILIVEENTDNVIGILTQLRLVEFFWENRTNFPVVDQLYPQLIKDLNIGSRSVIAIK